MSLPAALVEALTSPGGGRIVLVAGAGCSTEPPTNLKLSSVYSEAAHQKLVLAGLLEEGACDPWDLSSVADAIVAKHGVQRPVVDRLPRGEFVSAPANRGYLVAAALLKEGIVKAFVTLNYDLAISHALPEVSASHRVSVINEPADHAQFGARNVVYLHRSASADPETWVMTTQALERDWRDGWESIMTLSLVSAPVTVFAGLGSKAAVLTESVKRLRSRPGCDTTSQFLVGRSASPQGNKFFGELNIPEDNYVASGWCSFMNEVSAVVAANQLARVRQVCRDLCEERGWEQTEEHFDTVVAVCASLDLLALGRLRARWQLSSTKYLSEEEMGELGERALADLVMGAGHLHRILGGELRVLADGSVEVWDGDRCIERVTMAHGGGTRSVDLIQEELIRESDLLLHGRRPSRHVLVGGASASSSVNPLPGGLTGEPDEADLIVGPDAWSFVNIEQLRTANSAEILPWQVSS